MSAASRPKWPHRWRPDARRLLGVGPVCFDTMILTSLVRANKAQMLVDSMKARARMPTRVAGELRGHSHSNGEISKVVPPPPDGGSPGSASFGETVRLTRDEAQRAADLQRAWHGREAIDAKPDTDRGEAECIAVCERRGWPLISQDHRAVSAGSRRGVAVFGLPELLMLFAAEGRCLPSSAWKIYADIADSNERLVAQGWVCDDEAERMFHQCCDILCAANAAA